MRHRGAAPERVEVAAAWMARSGKKAQAPLVPQRAVTSVAKRSANRYAPDHGGQTQERRAY